jgi:hypothetical protein
MSQQNSAEVLIDSAVPLSDASRVGLLKQVDEINALGARVLKVLIDSADSPAKFFIRFIDPISDVRMALEAKLYDVGQRMVVKEPSFYVVKRLERTRGWSE